MIDKKITENVEWLVNTLDEFDNAIRKYKNEVKSTTAIDMNITCIKDGIWKMDSLGMEILIKLDDILSKSKIKSDSIEQKVYDYINNTIIIYVNSLKNKLI